MANGHIPGRVNPNPWQQIGATLSQRQQQGLQAIQSLLQGRTPPLPGLPSGGWTPDIGALNQFKEAALAALRDNPMLDMTAFEQAFIQPLLTSSVPGQLLALDYYTRKADITQNLANLPQVFSALSPVGHIDALMAQSEALTSLAQAFPTNPQVQQMVRNFVSTLAPGGQAAGLPTAALAALADPFLALAREFGSPEAAGLPPIQFPTTTQGIPAERRRLIEGIAQAMLGITGQAVTPFGLLPEQPTTTLRTLIEAGLEAFRNLPVGFGTPVAPTAPPSTGTGADTTRENLLTRVLQSVRDYLNQYAGLQPLVQRLLQLYGSVGFGPANIVQDLQRKRNEWVQQIGEERFNRLVQLLQGLAG